VESSYVVEGRPAQAATVERIRRLLDEAERLREEARRLAAELRSIAPQRRYPSLEPLLSSAVESLESEALALGDGDLAALASRLESYLRELRSRVEGLRRVTDKLKQLVRVVSLLEAARGELAEWERVATSIDLKLSAEVRRSLRRVERALSTQVSPEGLDDSLVYLSEALLEAQDTIRRCRGALERRLSELRDKVAAAEKLYRQAKRLAYLSEVERLACGYKRVAEARSALELLSREPLKVGQVSLAKLEREVDEFISECRESIGRRVGEGEARVLRALSSIARGGATVPLHSLADAVSRSAGVPVQDALAFMYRLSRQGLVTIRVKVK